MDKQVQSEEKAKVFHHHIRIRWADCDPASIAFTGRIPYFALEAIVAWWEEHLGHDWYEMNVDKDIGAPFVHLSIDFRAPVTPRHILDCCVRLIKVGESSVRFSVVGRQDDAVCFKGEFVEVLTASAAHKKMPFPDAMRAKLLTFCSN